MPHLMDHLVLAVPDLATAIALYRRLGFTVGSRNRHPWGTENHIVQLDGAFLEIIGLAQDYSVPGPNDPAAPFATAVERAVGRGGGLALVALRTGDAAAEAKRLSTAGLGAGSMMRFGRSAEAPDGSRRELFFTLAFADLPALPDAGFFACQHGRPEHFWNAEAQVHANGTLSLASVTLCLATPSADAGRLAVVCGAELTGPDEAPSIALVDGRIDLVPPKALRGRAGDLDLDAAAAGRFVAFGLTVRSLDAVRRHLDRSAVPYRDGPDGIMIGPDDAFGVAIAFEPGRRDRTAPGRTA